MPTVSFAGALVALRAMPSDERSAALKRLAHAAARGHELDGYVVFDPLECSADLANRCAYEGGSMVIGNRVCAAIFDPSLECPHGVERGRR